MELSNEKLIASHVLGKRQILKNSRRILDGLYWKNVEEERKLLIRRTGSLEESIDNTRKMNRVQEERRKLISEINKIDDQLGL